MKPIIAPSILSADFGYLAKDIEMINRSEAGWVHIDIMDGVFVPNISFGFRNKLFRVYNHQMYIQRFLAQLCHILQHRKAE